jgi:hypothetical protein
MCAVQAASHSSGQARPSVPGVPWPHCGGPAVRTARSTAGGWRESLRARYIAQGHGARAHKTHTATTQSYFASGTPPPAFLQSPRPPTVHGHGLQHFGRPCCPSPRWRTRWTGSAAGAGISAGIGTACRPAGARGLLCLVVLSSLGMLLVWAGPRLPAGHSGQPAHTSMHP